VKNVYFKKEGIEIEKTEDEQKNRGRTGDAR